MLINECGVLDCVNEASDPVIVLSEPVVLDGANDSVERDGDIVRDPVVPVLVEDVVIVPLVPLPAGEVVVAEKGVPLPLTDEAVAGAVEPVTFADGVV